MNAQEHWKSTLTTDRDTATDRAANDSNVGANHAEAANSDEVLDSGAASQDKMRLGPSPAEFGLTEEVPTDLMKMDTTWMVK